MCMCVCVVGGGSEGMYGQMEEEDSLKNVTVNHCATWTNWVARVLFKEHHIMQPLSKVLQHWDCYRDRDGGYGVFCCSVAVTQAND